MSVSEGEKRRPGEHGLLPGLCRVCQSPHRKDYERRMAEGWSGRRLERYSREIGEPISVSSFLNHREKHFKGELEKLKDERMEEIARSRIRLGMEAIEVLKSNLEVMNKGKEALAKVFANPEGLSGTMMGNAARLMGEIRLTSDALEAKLEKLRGLGEVDEEALASDLTRLIGLLCPECRVRVAEEIGLDPGDIVKTARGLL
ncbi:MAG TPA: hypothetical protein G4O03_01860 [Dehalococcoidia bacterium]|nr:hypothetical protein [Dehalococcoidia bacterium]